jgi:adenylate kinase
VHRRLVLLGPPAAGKGTQAELLKERFGFEAPSVGAMLREQKAAGTPAGLRAAEFFERGLLVPDEITIEVVRQWLAAHAGSWALDGYPRTIRQAEAFDTMCRDQGAPVDLAILILADEPVIRDRVANRLVCQACGRVFRAGVHVAQPSDPCPRCGGILGRRADDNLDALADRLTEYRTKTAPVISYYESRGILQTIDGNRPVETVFADFSALLEPAPASGS